MMTFELGEGRMLRVRQRGLMNPKLVLELIKAVPGKEGCFATEKRTAISTDEIRAFLAEKMGIDLKEV